MATVSVAICSRNRAASLRATLAALDATEVPEAFDAEVVVIDNGSADDTANVVATWRPAAFSVRYLVEPRQGVARARNTALAATTGAVIAFLDDDVRPSARWLERLCTPILSRTADAVAGGVRLAPHLERPWMERTHRTWLADTGYIDPHVPQEVVSANMAIGRHVLARVPGFDPELGPGALGQGEDALFSWQIVRAGFQLAAAFDAPVEHHLDSRRLLRASFRDAAERRGRTLAYQQHHWEHVTVPDVRRRLRRARLKLILRSLASPPRHEGMPVWEMVLRERIAFLRQWRVESVRPRNYERFGLVKVRGER
jgi:glycosyltransferase involved in cell wall biosynthesis